MSMKKITENDKLCYFIINDIEITTLGKLELYTSWREVLNNV